MRTYDDESAALASSGQSGLVRASVTIPTEHLVAGRKMSMSLIHGDCCLYFLRGSPGVMR
eukprot:CAMPEP_0178985400 /NCGR_PEP_ID=MMETSP0795-20121207/2132_1 /TAXON_ID=88552 /ORGANISM="Amoebophrya sp., Strain Ameob2" /LENGTH=59 /DNA_ID=CAMNT_0020676355 /DNA_START=319 /DNA_END=498 /DNA_ORIENTATION=+